MDRLRGAGLALFAFLLAFVPAPASAQTDSCDGTLTWTGIGPDCLAPGTKYRILFVTNNVIPRNRRSNQIGSWNAWVQEQAAASTVGLAAISSSFKILGSTENTNARVNTDTEAADQTTDGAVKIFYFKGNKVADDYADLYDSAWDSQSPRNENGASSPNALVWTGTNSSGTTRSRWLKSFGFMGAGRPSKLGFELSENTTANLSRVYGLSSVLTKNTPATGKPTVSGTARVGETLTAAPGNIADQNGLPSTFDYQWQQGNTDGSDANYTDVSGATMSTFSLAMAQQGRRIRVVASFTDDAGNPESRTSDPTMAVDGPPPSLDVDGNGTVGLLTDGLLLVRYLIDIRGSALTNLALAADAHEDRDTHEEITAYLQGLVDRDVLDVDGNGTVGLLTDGLLIVRYLIDIRGPELTNLALAADARADRDTHEEIVAYLDSLLPPQ